MQTQWQFFIFGTEREAMLQKKPGNTSKKFVADEVTFYVYDHLGNTRMTYKPTKVNVPIIPVELRIEYIAEYFAYGKTLREFVNTPERYLTTQHERDKETSLDYRGARFYDADVARFLSLDPLANKFLAWSAFNYVLSNPSMFIDPDGMEAKDWIKKKGSNTWEYDSRVQSKLGAEAFYGEGTEYKDDGETYQGSYQGVDVGTVTLNRGGLQSWEGGSYQNKDHNPNPESLLPNPFFQQMQNTGYPSLGFFKENRHWIGPAMILSGRPSNIFKPIGALGSQSGSSVASYTLRNVLPYKIPFKAKILGTRSLGGAIGRAVPFIGWGVTIGDGLHQVHTANKQYVQQQKAQGKTWITDTYSDVGILYWIFD